MTSYNKNLMKTILCEECKQQTAIEDIIIVQDTEENDVIVCRYCLADIMASSDDSDEE